MTISSEPIIRFDRVEVVFTTPSGAVRALDKVELDVAPRKFTTVVGPSGCGKTTLLRLASGLVMPAAGRTLYKGRPLSGLNSKVGFVTQESNLFPWLTLVENVEFPLAVRGVRPAERRDRARDCIKRVGLEGFESHYPFQLSGGMQKRASIIRTLIYEPEVVLMD